MPTIARIREGKTVREHKNKYGPGITPHYLESDQVGVVEFDSTLFTAETANEWLTSHDYKALSIVADGKEQADKEKGKERKHRFLSVELSPASGIHDVDGGLLVPGVKLLAPGTWTDSTQKTPCRYTPEVLERYCSNWIDRSYWSRHSGGTPRDITDRIADLQNIRYNDGVTADLFFHGATSKSLDAISLIKAAAAGKIPWPYSSVEMRTRDKWIISEKLFEAEEILYDGAAMVNQGACRTCKIRNNSGVWIEVTPEMEQTQESVKEQEQEQEKELVELTDNTKEKELEAQVETLKKELADVKAASAAKPEVKVEVPKELTEALETIKKLSEKVEKLEKTPKAPITDPGVSKELSLPEYYVPVDRTKGMVG